MPPNLDYDFWLGPTPVAPYTEKRVHPQADYGRPGWLRIMAYGHGMITGWGSHHLDIAQWGLGTEDTGPVEITGKAEYPKSGLWDVHGDFHIEYMYENGVKMICTDDKANPHGIRFDGSDGWVHVKRGFIDANPKSLLQEKIGPRFSSIATTTTSGTGWTASSHANGGGGVQVVHGVSVGFGAIQLGGKKLKWNPKKEDSSRRLTGCCPADTPSWRL